MIIPEDVKRVSPSRYAIYFAPDPASHLWRFGSAVLGFDAATGRSVPPPPGAPFDRPGWSTLTEEPRRYGFHATLKAPFSLASSADEARLIEAARLFARCRRAFEVNHLEIEALGSFVALVPSRVEPSLDILAADVVRTFEPFRAPLSDHDRQRRLLSPLTGRQQQQLDAWGYPYIFDDFRFHMTLTGRLPPDDVAPIRSELASCYAALPPGLVCDAIAIFRQDRRDSRFRLIERCPFGA